MLGGYDCTFVSQPTSAFQTECPICCLVLRDPYQSTCCGTSFCHSCFERVAEHNPCPVCRELNFEMFPNKGLKRALNQLQVFCTHAKDGCKWSGELGDLEQHLSEVHSGEANCISSAKCIYCLGCTLEGIKAYTLLLVNEAYSTWTTQFMCLCFLNIREIPLWFQKRWNAVKW